MKKLPFLLTAVLLAGPGHALAQPPVTLTVPAGRTTAVRTQSLIESVTMTRVDPALTVQVGDLQVNFVAAANARPGTRSCVRVVTEQGRYDLCAVVGAATSALPRLP